LIKELKLFHYLKNCQEANESSPNGNDKSPFQKQRSPSRDGDIIIIPQNTVLKSLVKVFRVEHKKTVTQRCILLVNSNKHFGFKTSGCSETKEYNRTMLSANIDLGAINMMVYSLAVEDICKILATYRELYNFKDEDNPEVSSKTIVEDVKDLQFAKHREISISNDPKPNHKAQYNSCLSYLDELTFKMNMDVRVTSEGMNWGIHESKRNEVNSVIKSRPFTSASIPTGTLILTKRKESTAASAFGFTFTTTKPAGFTALFGEVNA